MKYPNRVQSVLMFDRPVESIDPIIRDFSRIEEMNTGVPLNLSEHNPGRFARLFDGQDEMMVTIELVDGPANPDAFRGALSSAYTGLVCPDIRQRLDSAHCHIIVEISHGVLGGVEENPKIAAFFETIGRERSGATRPLFERRLKTLAMISRICSDHAQPSAVHWTQSDVLIPGEMLEEFATHSVPGLFHIHPFLFGPRAAAGEPSKVGIRTFGARHWLGAEVLIQPHTIAWAHNYEAILNFLDVALTENGYIIPDGDTFGPEDQAFSYRVIHHEAGSAEGDEDDVPLYELVPLLHKAAGFQSDDYVPRSHAVDDRSFSADFMPQDEEDKMALANEVAAKRKMAEGIGGTFELRRIPEPGDPEPDPQPPRDPPQTLAQPTPTQPGMPTLSGRGLRARVFGSKQA